MTKKKSRKLTVEELAERRRFDERFRARLAERYAIGERLEQERRERERKRAARRALLRRVVTFGRG